MEMNALETLQTGPAGMKNGRRCIGLLLQSRMSAKNPEKQRPRVRHAGTMIICVPRDGQRQ